MATRVIVSILLLLPATATSGLAPAAQTGSPRRVIHITAERFEFWPTEIRLTEGEEVEIRVKSDDTAHGFRIVGGGVNLTVPKRGQGEAVTVFKPEKSGRYTFECSRMCGAGHNFMRGVLIVDAPEEQKARSITTDHTESTENSMVFSVVSVCSVVRGC